MSNETVKLPVIKRNGEELELSVQVFGKKSPHAGKKFFAPELTSVNWDKAVKWIGADTIGNVMSRALRKVFGEIFVDEDNYNTDGTVNWDSMYADYADFSAGVAKLSDLEEQISELQDQVSVIVMDDDYECDENDKPLNPEKFAVLALQAKALTMKIRPLKALHKQITEKYALRAQKRADKAAKSETKTA